jgi:hypothetical protein
VNTEREAGKGECNARAERRSSSVAIRRQRLEISAKMQLPSGDEISILSMLSVFI